MLFFAYTLPSEPMIITLRATASLVVSNFDDNDNMPAALSYFRRLGAYVADFCFVLRLIHRVAIMSNTCHSLQYAKKRMFQSGALLCIKGLLQ
jgi:hypothetical protein